MIDALSRSRWGFLTGGTFLISTTDFDCNFFIFDQDTLKFFRGNPLTKNQDQPQTFYQPLLNQNQENPFTLPKTNPNIRYFDQYQTPETLPLPSKTL